MSTSKRQDLQGIRGIAIVSVLLFHFFPKYCPNGYLGVDQFFVLSGFLMCMLLTKTENESVFFVLSNFYSRRFKRILPLYFLIILVTIIALYTVYPTTSILQNQSSANNALMFLSNRPQTGDEDYYKKLSVAIDLFTHTWSLSVEIQFYLIAPFIFLIGSKFDHSMKYGHYLLIAFVSFAFNLISSEEISFNSVFARIWQFLIGMIVYLYSTFLEKTSNSYKLLESSENETLEDNDKLLISSDTEENEITGSRFSDSIPKCFLIISIILILIFPIQLPSEFSRPIFTILTGFLMMISTNDIFLSNRFLTYIGDISYSLYLIHWPIYAFTKLKFGENDYALISGLIISILLAVCIFETFEKWYLTLSNHYVFLITLVLLVSNVVLINKDKAQDKFFLRQNSFGIDYQLNGVDGNMTIDDAERMNSLWNKYDLLTMLEPGCIKRTPNHKRWCDFDGKNGTFKIALFGNSYTLNHHKMVIQECKSKSYNISMYSEKGCEPLAADPEDSNCVNKLEEYVEYIKSANPDYAFMFTRFFIINKPFPNNTSNLDQDKIYLKMRRQLKRFLPFIQKKLFILDSIPRVIAKKVENIAKNLKEGKTVQEISKSLIEPDGYENARFRHAALVKECGVKCELIDYLPLFWNKRINTVQYFDNRGFSYFNSFYHLSPHGIEHVRSIYRRICADLK